MIAKLNHTLRSKSDEEKCVEYVKVKMRVLFSQHLSYKVSTFIDLIVIFYKHVLCSYVIVIRLVIDTCVIFCMYVVMYIHVCNYVYIPL